MLKIFISFLFYLNLALAANQTGVVEINKPQDYQHVYVISDVHGMYDEIKELLVNAHIINQKLQWQAGPSLLIVVGDSIDKGDHSVEVLDLWMKLTDEANSARGQLLHVLGNHEAELLAFGKHSNKSKKLFAELEKRSIKKKEFIAETSRWGKYLRSMPLAAKVGKWLFCHSGYYPKLAWSEFVQKAQSLLKNQDYENEFIVGEQSILEMKDWWVNKNQVNDLLLRLDQNQIYGIVQGHQPKAFGIKNKIGAIANGRLIKIDNGMAPEAGSHSGSILHFKNPQQMNLSKGPDLEIINQKGNVKDLKLYQTE